MNTSGIHHVGVGYGALFSNTTGAYNVAVGRAALGDAVAVTGSNMVRIGDGGVTSIGGYANWSNISDGRFKIDVKEDVAGLEFIMRLRPVTYRVDPEKIAAFHNTPDEFRKPESEALKKEVLETGFIAQEVEEAAGTLGYDFSGVDAPLHEGDPYSLRYATFVVPLVKAVQEQQETISQMKQQLAQQKQQEHMISALKLQLAQQQQQIANLAQQLAEQ